MYTNKCRNRVLAWSLDFPFQPSIHAYIPVEMWFYYVFLLECKFKPLNIVLDKSYDSVKIVEKRAGRIIG